MQQKNGEFVLEYRINLEKDNQFTWWECRGIIETMEEDGMPHHHMYGMAINIEVRKKAELLLIKNRQKMVKLNLQNELILNNVNSGLAYITKDFVVQWENISICDSYISFGQYKQGELCYESAHKQNEPCKNCIVQQAMVTRHLEKTKFLQNNGRMIEVFATPVLDKNQEVEGVVLRLDDITEHQNMINELEKAKWKAEESDRLKSAFLANMSHEIRTPLNAIVGFSDLLMITADPKEKEDYIKIINTNNELLLKLINDILDLSKIESGAIDLNYVYFDVAPFFNELYTFMQQRVTNPQVVLASNNPYSSCIVKMDKNRLAQIIINYVTNSIKYTAKGHIKMGYFTEKGKLHIYVQDTGIGIPDNKKHKVFQRFEKLDDFAQGTGLGLSICKAIAKACGGKVGFNSVVGQGSTFWATLPCEVKKTLLLTQ